MSAISPTSVPAPLPDASEVEHDRLAQAGAVQPRHGIERRQARQLRVGRQQAAVAQVDAQHHAAGSSASSRSSASGPDSVSVPTITRCAPSVQQRPRPVRLADARVDHHARLARQRGDAGVVLALAGDGVEVGDVELVEPELGAERAGQRERVAVV